MNELDMFWILQNSKHINEWDREIWMSWIGIEFYIIWHLYDIIHSHWVLSYVPLENDVMFNTWVKRIEKYECVWYVLICT